MSNGKFYRFSFFILCSILSCSETDELIQGIPRIVTSNVFTGVNGAVFEAAVLSNGKGAIVDHGFQWRESGKFEMDFVSAGPLESNNFKLEVNQAFEETKRYEVRAYLITSTQKAFGEWVEFSGAGSKAPVLSAISPLVATWGDTLVISGKYFSNNSGVMKVEFGDAVGELISSTDSLLKVKVPLGFIKTSTTSIRVKVGAKFGTSSQLFTLLETQALQVTPDEGGAGTVITIKGRYFNTAFSSVKFGDVAIPVDKYFSDSLKIILPKEIAPSEKDVTVISGPFRATLVKAFKRNSPILLDVIPTSGFFGDTVVLRGENFGSKFIDNQVSVNEVYATILNVKENELKIIVPTVALPELRFSITADYAKSESEKQFKIENPRIDDLFPDSPLYPGQSITIKGDNFYPSIYSYPYSYQVKVDNQNAPVISVSRMELKAELPLLTTNTSLVQVVNFDTININSAESISTPVARLSNFPGDQRSDAVSFTIGNKSYVIGGILLSTLADNEVYEFDASSKSWRTVQNFPGTPRYGATAFTINNKGYVLGGYGESGNLNPLRDLWEYDPVNDSWTRKNDYLFHPLEAFNMNGEILCLSDISYLIIPPSTEISGFGYNTEFWKYDPTTDSWTKRTSPSYTLKRDPYGSQDYFTMQIGANLTIGYLDSNYAAYIYQKYNTQSDTWIDKGYVEINGNSPITFDYGGNGYLLVNEQLHKYDPNLNQWNLIEDDLSNLLWQGGDPIKFRMNDFWYFGLFSYNGRYIESLAPFKNMMLEFNCQLAGF
jgi:IPT/TIG domain/Kelch motif